MDERPDYHQLVVQKSKKRYENAGGIVGEKLNIFEGDPKEIDEKLMNIEKENQLMAQSQTIAQLDQTQSLDIIQKPFKWNANLNYLRETLKNRESRKEFVLQSRELLFKEISIRNKKEETEKLKEFIDTENEKLIEAKNSFKEDSDKFQKYVEELTLKAEQAKRETELLVEKKQKKQKKINQLREELAEINREIGKVDDELGVTHAHKDFIMDLSSLLSTAVKKGKQRHKNDSDESDSDFFITKQGEGQEELPEGEGSISQLSDKEELPMDKAMLLDLMVLLGTKYLIF